MRSHSARGQATTETLISMLFLMLFVWGAVHMAMFAVSKSIASYGAFYGARTAMVNGEGRGLGNLSPLSQGALAARQAMSSWRLETLVWLQTRNRTNRGVTRKVFHTISFSSFGVPIFKTPVVFVLGDAPLTVDTVVDSGDNK